MKSLFSNLLLGVVLSAPLVVPGPAAADDDYWNNHWSWYDNTYRPYYYRGYSAAPRQNSYYGPGYYGGGYGAYPGPGYYAAPAPNNYGYGRPYGQYYGTGNIGYGRTYGGRQAVNVGGMTFGWR